MIAAAGADAIGLNFYAGSPRCVSLETAEAIVAALPAGVQKIGLFVDTPAAEICRLYDRLQLDCVQLHGDQPAEFVTQLVPRPTIRAFRVIAGGEAAVATLVAECRQRGCPLEMVLVDACVPGALGGTGQKADWPAVRHLIAQGDLPPLVLAGGLTPGNVAEAIRVTGAAAVDTASGVESSPGVKSPALVAAFVAAARGAIDSRPPLPPTDGQSYGK
jgi:phosphoribosylanthranilate isomerase